MSLRMFVEEIRTGLEVSPDRPRTRKWCLVFNAPSHVQTPYQWVVHLHGMLKAAFPSDMQVLSINDEVWEKLDEASGDTLVGEAGAIRRGAVEMQLWRMANGFVPTRSTMSDFMCAFRTGELSEQACNRHAQRDWMAKQSGLDVP
jgi:hypothetical protein